jgi:hypothetical protein
MPKQAILKVKVALKMSPMTDLQLIDFSKHVVDSMTANPHFPAPFPSLADLTTLILDFESAFAVAYNGPPTTTAHKLVKRQLLHGAMTLIGAYVEGIANLDPPNALKIVFSAGMEVRSALPPKASGFRLKLTGNPGEVVLMTDRVRSAAYKWEYTTTPDDPASWLVYLENMKREVLLKGLNSATRYYFRVAVILHGSGPWSRVIDTVIL